MRGVLLGLMAAGLVVGCGESTGIDGQPDVSMETAEVLIDWTDEEGEPPDCDDGVECTVDSWESGECVNTPDSSACADEIGCNGEEVCDPVEGCLPGDPDSVCDDLDPCTEDICVERPPFIPACDHPPLDEDGDSVPAETAPDGVTLCPGGTDCDDTNPEIFPFAGEWCDNGIDDDCDDLIDGEDTSDCP
jgi:hypothetical protein